MSNFFYGPRKTVLAVGEILTQVVIPSIGKKTAIIYKKFKLRGANALAVASVATRITVAGNLIKEGRIVLGAVAPVPMIAELASEMLAGQIPSHNLFFRVAEAAAAEAKPISDIRGSREYRKELIQVLTKQSLDEAFKRATGGGD
jgi:carbon-monoxide dehydrogenase medium subunit